MCQNIDMNMKNHANISTVAQIIKEKGNNIFFIPWVGAKYEKGWSGKRILVIGASHYCNHSNKCICPNDSKICNFLHEGKCKKGCPHYQECTNGQTKRFNAGCNWMNEQNEHSSAYKELCDSIEEHKLYGKLESTTLDEVYLFLDHVSRNNKSFEKFTNLCIKLFDQNIPDFLKDAEDKRVVIWEHIAFANYAQNFQPNSTGNGFQKNDFNAFTDYISLIKPDIVIVWGCDLGGNLAKNGFKTNAKQEGYVWKKSVSNKEITFINSYHPSYSCFEDDGKLINILRENIFNG